MEVKSNFLVEFDVSSLNEETRSRLWVHAVQLVPERAFRDWERLEAVALEPAAKATVVIPTVVGALM